MRISGDEAEKNTIRIVAEKMCTAARTAPKTKGEDYIKTLILTDEELVPIAAKMKEIAETSGMRYFLRDAENILQSSALVFIGTQYAQRELNSICGLCGFADCGKSKKAGATCAFDSIDLGIAVCAAVSIAADNRVDNRIMYSAGKAALDLNYFDNSVKSIMAIPISVSGKSIYFDRDFQE